MDRPEPDIAGKHFASTSIDEIPDVVQHSLQNEAERVAITTAAWRQLQQHLILAQSGGKLLGLMERRPT